MPSIISVFGSSMPHPGSADYEAARDLGRRLAEAGFAVQTGGYAGIMEAVSRGANEAGGHVVGVTCATFEAANSAAPNAWVKEVVQQPNLPSRVLYLVTACDGAIVMPGGVGTLSELALAWSLVQVREVPPKPIVLVGGLWQRTLAAFVDRAYIYPQHAALLTLARTPAEAVNVLVERVMDGQHL
jgi:uncharacterized protein (TIGR00730 family)